MVKDVLRLADDLRSDGKVDVVRLARELDIRVLPIGNITEIGTSAYIEKDNGSFSIHVNGNQSRQRQRFSIAHEIAHYSLHNQQLNKLGKLHRGSVQQLSFAEEKSADELAAKILMPDADIREELREMGITSETKLDPKMVEKLCERYDVSFYAMIVKLRDLDYFVPFINVYE